MSVLTSPRTYAGLAAFQAGDAVACAIPLPFITTSLDTLEVPASVRPVLPVVKAASAIGLLSVTRFPALARLTTARYGFGGEKTLTAPLKSETGWPDRLFEVLKTSDIRQVGYVPDAGHARLIER